jgi:2-dehydro-3-deoxy-D-arabinonate dehydratase
MRLTRHQTPKGPRWAADGHWLANSFNLRQLLQVPRAEMAAFLEGLSTTTPVPAELLSGSVLAPIESDQEVWASGVTYLRSRDARQAESTMGNVYDRVYVAERPELFFKAIGWRVTPAGKPLRIRADSAWNVPEPELTLVINCQGEIVGYTAGNDMSSRSIEGENPLYLPQAKIYDGSCSLGPAIVLAEPAELSALPIAIAIERAAKTAFRGSTSIANMNRRLEDLACYLYKELSFPHGAFLLTGTGIVPPESFTLDHGDMVYITVGAVTLVNQIK